jgi:hypothetical protein
MDDSPPNTESTSSRQAIHLSLGRLVSTPGAIAAMARTKTDPAQLLSRHRRGDWGDLGSDDRATNDAAVVTGGRILSAYRVHEDDTTIWIITEGDRSATTFLLPDEY